MLIGKYQFLHLFFVFGLSVSNVACAKSSDTSCSSNNVSQNLICLKKQNEILKNKLEKKGNTKKSDYKSWLDIIKNKCEGRKSYTLGEGAALVREDCYKSEYNKRLVIMDSKNALIRARGENRNEDGFLVTSLPYNSDDHISCLLKENKSSCSKVNLIDIVELSNVYNFLDQSSGASVIFPETEDGIILIAQPSSSDSEGAIITLVSINALGVKKTISLDASHNILIDQSYRIKTIKNKREYKLILDKNGNFVK